MKKTNNQCEAKYCRQQAELTHKPIGMRLCYSCLEKYYNTGVRP